MELNGLQVVAFDGAEIRALNKDGETIRQVTLSVGPHDLTPFRTLAEFGDLELVNVNVLNRPSDNARITPFSRRIETDCNADWKPTVSMDPRIQRQFDQRVLKMVRKNAEGEAERARQDRIRLYKVEQAIIERENHPDQKRINKKKLEKDENDGTIRVTDTDGDKADKGTGAKATEAKAEIEAKVDTSLTDAGE